MYNIIKVEIMTSRREGDGVKWVDVGIVILTSYKFHSIRVHDINILILSKLFLFLKTLEFSLLFG